MSSRPHVSILYDDCRWNRVSVPEYSRIEDSEIELEMVKKKRARSSEYGAPDVQSDDDSDDTEDEEERQEIKNKLVTFTPVTLTSLPWEVREVPGKGMAVFALKFFPADSIICKEKPLIWLPFWWPFSEKQADEVQQRVDELSDSDYSSFMGLSNVYSDARNEAAGIFMTNSFDMTGAPHGQSCACYVALARLNHCCNPNARQEYNVDTFEEVLFAERDIYAGEQINCSYVDVEADVDKRRKELKTLYHFLCDCFVCVEEIDAKAYCNPNRKSRNVPSNVYSKKNASAERTRTRDTTRKTNTSSNKKKANGLNSNNNIKNGNSKRKSGTRSKQRT